MHVLDPFLGWLIPFVCGIAITSIAGFWKQRRALNSGIQALLRQRLIDMHDRYVQNDQPCPVNVKEEATNVYNSYHALGGNGTGTHLYDEIMSAHVKSDDSEDYHG